MQNFSGTLYYDNACTRQLTVGDYIVRADTVTFSITLTSIEHLGWKASSLAFRTGDGTYYTRGVKAEQSGRPSSP